MLITNLNEQNLPEEHSRGGVANLPGRKNDLFYEWVLIHALPRIYRNQIVCFRRASKSLNTVLMHSELHHVRFQNNDRPERFLFEPAIVAHVTVSSHPAELLSQSPDISM
jgi:hypothetical protein